MYLQHIALRHALLCCGIAEEDLGHSDTIKALNIKGYKSGAELFPAIQKLIHNCARLWCPELGL